jgi:hypothetical protein
LRSPDPVPQVAVDVVVLEEVDSDGVEEATEVVAEAATVATGATADLVEATEMVEVVAMAVVDTEEVVEDLVVRLMTEMMGDGIREGKKEKKSSNKTLHSLHDEKISLEKKEILQHPFELFHVTSWPTQKIQTDTHEHHMLDVIPSF